MKPYKIVFLYSFIILLTYFLLYIIKLKHLVEHKNNIKIKDAIKEFQLEQDAKELYLNEKFLRVVKNFNQSCDSKNIVDRPTKKPLNQVLEALDSLNETDLLEIQRFVNEYLHEPGIEIVRAEFRDWKPAPNYINKLKSEYLKNFTISLNEIWLDLYKKFDVSKLDKGSVSSHLPMKYPFLVPGGRFLEMYYWDSYWIIEGLLVSGMFETSKEIIDNHIFMIEKYGYVPNGSRVYYLNRSQPPYFSLMVFAFYEAILKTNELNDAAKKEYKRFVLNEAFNHMLKEYTFWIQHRSIQINYKDKNYTLNIYNSDSDRPRPESYFEDLNTAKNCKNEQVCDKLFKNIGAAAESGIDFSSRWFRDPMYIQTIQTTDIVPIDLNSILYKVEMIISNFYILKGDLNGFKKFRLLANKRKSIINSLMWSDKLSSWADYNIAKKCLNEENFYITNLSPLWMDIRPSNMSIKRVIDVHLNILNKQDGGVPFSFVNSTQQWDFANAWPPNQHSLIMMLAKHNKELALVLAKKFFFSVYLGWVRSGMIYEKYSSIIPGERGTGGEYVVQAGFGWSNGAVLTIINSFKDELLS